MIWRGDVVADVELVVAVVLGKFKNQEKIEKQ
mgnify:CR=1 FL=1